MDALPMLDTIAIRADWPLRDPRPDGWRKQLSNTSPVLITVKAARLKWAEVSLPRLLFGHNGRTLENQVHLDAALAKMREDLNTFADVPEIGVWQIWRADIAWNFDMKAGPLVLAHAALRVPGIHRGATLFDGGQCVSWLDANSRFKVMLYDKARKMHISGSILRAEISLCGHKLNRHFDAGEFQNFGAIYRVFRRIMAGIPPIQKPNKAANWQAALGAESPEIRERFLARLAHKPKNTFRRYRRMVEAAAANLPESFSWANILPDDAPPPAVHCEPRNQTRRGRRGGTPGLLK